MRWDAQALQPAPAARASKDGASKNGATKDGATKKGATKDGGPSTGTTEDSAARGAPPAADALLPLIGLVRSVSTPEFAGVTFHEVTAKSVLNKVVAGSRMPFEWTINP